MKQILLTSLAAALLTIAAIPAQAAPVLVPSGGAPTELQLGEHAVFTLAVHNTGNQAASGVVLRMPLPAGLAVQPPGSGLCAVVTEPFPSLGGQVRQIKCSVGNVSAGRSKSFSMVVRAPTQPLLSVRHRVLATATNASSAQSPWIMANYQHYDVPITPGLQWEVRSCNNGTAGPLAYNICPPSSEVVGEVVLAAGGYLTDTEGQVSPDDRWLQTSPHVLRIDWTTGGVPAAVSNYTAISSTCLRGPGQTIPQPGQPIVYLASKICRM
jgi:uncharacterized repeat protein (TIGR01451 family)